MIMPANVIRKTSRASLPSILSPPEIVWAVAARGRMALAFVRYLALSVYHSAQRVHAACVQRVRSSAQSAGAGRMRREKAARATSRGRAAALSH
jgi:hypothetical protein